MTVKGEHFKYQIIYLPNEISHFAAQLHAVLEVVKKSLDVPPQVDLILTNFKRLIHTLEMLYLTKVLL